MQRAVLSNPGRRQLFSDIADKLRKDIRSGEFPYGQLPSLDLLSRRYGVAQATMVKTVHALRDTGVLLVHQGRRIQVDPTEFPRSGISQEGDSSARKLFEKIRRDIAEGTLRRSQHLPKVAYYTISEKVTARTVTKAFRLLEEARLAHKEGKYWIVGPAERRTTVRGARRLSSPPTVLIVVPFFEPWRILNAHVHTRSFVSEFSSELMRYNLDSYIVIERENPLYNVTSGRKRIRQRIESLGKSYVGALLVPDLWKVTEEEIREQATWFSRFGEPVIWIDYSDTGAFFCDKSRPTKLYYRCVGNQDTIVRTALDELHRLGHRTIGLLGNDTLYAGHRWQRQRIELVQKLAVAYNPPITVYVEMLREEFWSRKAEADDESIFPYLLSIRQKIEKENAHEPQAKRERLFCAKLLHLIPSLTTLINDRNVTALMGLNDYLTTDYMLWLHLVGVSVPGDMSVMSFDNDIERRHYPISSVDQGLGSLGYYAAHVFIGDVPIKADRQGNILNKPELLDRGSLGAPRKNRIRLVC